jgi:hypothetical protein
MQPSKGLRVEALETRMPLHEAHATALDYGAERGT